MTSPVVMGTTGRRASGAMVVPCGPDPTGGVTVTATGLAVVFLTRRYVLGPAGNVSAAVVTVPAVAVFAPARRDATTGTSAVISCPFEGGNQPRPESSTAPR